ncbi:hypothetical protein BDZ89DRAFT_494735 [Hymenopellis radicata]|nr:hypothetical protein BDZ89DRAFT_494735 [Hymenopellis radicata]
MIEVRILRVRNVVPVLTGICEPESGDCAYIPRGGVYACGEPAVGVVVGPLRLLSPLVWFKFWLYGIQPEECAEYMLSALLYRVKEEGWSRRDEHGDDIGTRCYNISEEDKRVVWEHSVEETSV